MYLMNRRIKIKAISKRNGLTVTIAGVALLAFVTLTSGMGLLAKIPTYVGVSLSLAAIFVGFIKLREPDYSLMMDDSGVTYQHARGRWQIPWSDIQRIDVPTVSHGLSQKQLPYVALRLKSQLSLLDNISPRLASYLVTEQRELVIAALKDDFSDWQCKDGTCPSEVLYKFDDYKIENKVYRGLIAMLGHRVATLRDKLGYDVYIPASALDREPQEFVGLLRKLKASI